MLGSYKTKVQSYGGVEAMKKIVLLISMLCVFGLARGNGFASATVDPVYTGGWEPTDTNLNFAHPDIWSDSSIASPVNLYFHPYGDTSSTLTLFSKGQTPANTVYFDQDDTTWKASLLEGFNPATNGISLGANPYFDLYAEVNSSTQDFTYSYTEVQADLQYGLNFAAGSVDTDFQLTMTDASPIPLPGAAWILGAGLLCLIGFRRTSRRLNR